MINNVIKYFASVFVAFCFAACSEIAEDERFVEQPLPDVKRNVLIEDFTGQSCVNCPDASDLIHELQEQYGEDVVIGVGIYSGPFGKTPTSNKILNLMTEQGQRYWDHWFASDTPQPVGKINRKPYQYAEDWKSSVNEALSIPTKMELSVASSDFNPESRSYSIEVHVKDESIERGLLQVWLVEDSIVAYQKRAIDGQTKILFDYTHNHVFRTSMIPLADDNDWGMGEEIALGQASVTCKNYVMVLDEAWKPENMSAVVFVTSDNGVEQVVKTPVIRENQQDSFVL